MEKKNKYKARKDLIFILPILLILIAVIVCIAIFLPRAYLWQYVFILVLFSFVLIAFLFSIFRTYYVFEEDYLLIVSGFFKKKIYYRFIENIKPVKSFVSSLCLSFDRLKIYRGKSISQVDYIAPVDKQEVMEELENRAEKAREVLNYR